MATKSWNYNGREYTMTMSNGYGQYTLNGYHFTDASVWDYVDDDDYPDKKEMAMKVAEAFINTKF